MLKVNLAVVALIAFPMSSQALIRATSVTLTTWQSVCSDCDYRWRNHYTVSYIRVPSPDDNLPVPYGLNMFGLKQKSKKNRSYPDTWHRSNEGWGWNGIPGTSSVSIRPGMTRKEAEEMWLAKNGNGPVNGGNYTTRYQGPETEVCATIVIGSITTGIEGDIYDQIVCTGSNPPEETTCDLGGDVEFSFITPTGSVSLTSSASRTLQCSNTATVRVSSLDGSSKITLPWGSASITLNNQTLPVTLRPQPNAIVNYGVTVTGNGATPGNYQGALTLLAVYE